MWGSLLLCRFNRYIERPGQFFYLKIDHRGSEGKLSPFLDRAPEFRHVKCPDPVSVSIEIFLRSIVFEPPGLYLTGGFNPGL